MSIMDNEPLLRAWIRREGDNFVAAFVAVLSQRQPAVRSCGTAAEAIGWIEAEAEAVAARVEWQGCVKGRGG
jgi:hypothetical protein